MLPTADEIVEQAQQEIARVQNEPVAAAELERARTLLRSDKITALQSSLRRAQLLAQYELLDQRPELINTDLQKFLAVGPAEIQAAAKKYLTPEHRSVLQIVPAPPAAADENN